MLLHFVLKTIEEKEKFRLIISKSLVTCSLALCQVEINNLYGACKPQVRQLEEAREAQLVSLAGK